jgi:hypothetical protein
MGRVVHGASCPWGELSMGRVVYGASCLETSGPGTPHYGPLEGRESDDQSP